MSAGWKQISVNCPIAQVDELVALAERLGAQAVTQQNADEDSYYAEACYDLAAPSEPQWQRQKVTALFSDAQFSDEVLLLLKLQVAEDTPLLLENLAEQHWQTAWQKQHRAQEVDAQLWVCPSWIAQDFSADTLVIKIDPGLAFGSGSHETTQLCMQILKQLDCRECRVLDYGCGSGILAITALKLGAHSAVGVDIDSKAAVVAMENAQANAVAAQFSMQTAGQIKDAAYEVVVANILAGALIDLKKPIAAAVKDGGSLILSGILSPQAAAVKLAYGDFEFSVKQKNQWVALVGVKRAL